VAKRVITESVLLTPSDQEKRFGRCFKCPKRDDYTATIKAFGGVAGASPEPTVRIKCSLNTYSMIRPRQGEHTSCPTFIRAEKKNADNQPSGIFPATLRRLETV
jgi:hypothetical protein